MQLRGGRPVGRLLGQTGPDHRKQRAGHLAEVGLLVHHPVEHHLGGPRAERGVAGRRVGEGGAQREHVGGAGDGDAADLLGGQEAGRADRRADMGQRAGAGGPGDAEVDDPRALGGQQDVRRLEVAVHHPGLVDVDQAVGEGGADRGHLGPGQRPLVADPLVERGAGDVGGRQPGPLHVDVGGDQPGDAAAPDPGGGGDLAGEAGAELLVLGQLGADQLERDLLALAVGAQVDHAHAARAEPPVQAVGADDSRILPPEPHHRHISVPPSVPCAGAVVPARRQLTDWAGRCADTQRTDDPWDCRISPGRLRRGPSRSPARALAEAFPGPSPAPPVPRPQYPRAVSGRCPWDHADLRLPGPLGDPVRGDPDTSRVRPPPPVVVPEEDRPPSGCRRDGPGA